MRTQCPERVLVTSDQDLVSEAIAAALADRGYLVTRWPWSQAARRTTDAEVGLLLSDLERPPRTRRALAVLHATPLPWLVLTAADHGPVWGGLLQEGARLVGPSSTTLDELEPMLTRVARGRGTPATERRRLIADWHRLEAEQADLAERIATMTPREREVLGHLYAGTPVRSIARRLHLSEATVRSQVQRVLRKLGVRSQLAAVAALSAASQPADEVIASLTDHRPVRSPKSGKGAGLALVEAAEHPGMDPSRRTGELG